MTNGHGGAPRNLGVALLLAVAGLTVLAGSGLLAASGPSAGDASVSASQAVVARSGSASAGGSDASVSGRVALSPILVDLAPVVRNPKSKGPVEITATVVNLGADRLSPVVLSLEATPTTLVVRPTDQKPIRNLGPTKAAQLTWSLCALAGGMFELRVLATTGGTTVATAPIMLTLPRARC